MTWTIRGLEPTDYDGIAAVHNACYPDYAEAAADFARSDAVREAHIRWGRFVATAEGEVVAWARYANASHAFHPRKFWVEVAVHPDWRRRGIGAALYARLQEALSPFDPVVLRAELREDNAVGWAWAAARGFALDYKEQESRLDIRAFDTAAFAADLARVQAAGIVLRSYAELSEDPEHQRKLHALDHALSIDVPGSDPPTAMDFEAWRRHHLEHPRFLPDLNMVALDGDRWVGLSNLWADQVAGRVSTGLTGVLRSHRQRGIATALKVAVLGAAKAAGHAETITWNAESNRGMLGINFRLGFVPTPAWMMIEKVLDAAALAASAGEEAS